MPAIRARLFNSILPTIFTLGVGHQLFNAKIHQSPTFQGIPVAGTLLLDQANSIFKDNFPGLELSGVFNPGQTGHSYSESGTILSWYPQSCQVEIPVYQVLSKKEEETLGKALVKKPIVGILRLEGDCKVGCAKVTLKKLTLFKVNLSKEPDYSAVVWTWTK